MSLTLKKSIGVVLGSAVLIVVASAGVFVFAHYKNNQRILRAIADADKLMREDTYGGETPEETFAMFLDALRAGDTDLASKYFVLSKQEEWKRKIEIYKIQNNLSRVITEIETIQSNWAFISNDDKVTKYSYSDELTATQTVFISGEKVDISAGFYKNTAVFSKNQNGKWKISQL